MKTFYRFIQLALLISLRLDFAQSQNSLYYFGEFKASKRITYYDSLYYPINYFASAIVYDDSTTNYNCLKTGQLGVVSFDGKTLNYNSTIRLYLDSVQRKGISSASWILNSANYGLVTLNQANTFPEFHSIHKIPNTLKKSESFIVEFDSINNTDIIDIFFFDGQMHDTFPFNRHVESTNLITIPNYDLSTLNNSNIVMQISFIKITYLMVNNRRFKLENRTDFLKTLNVTN